MKPDQTFPSKNSSFKNKGQHSNPHRSLSHGTIFPPFYDALSGQENSNKIFFFSIMLSEVDIFILPHSKVDVVIDIYRY